MFDQWWENLRYEKCLGICSIWQKDGPFWHWFVGSIGSESVRYLSRTKQINRVVKLTIEVRNSSTSLPCSVFPIRSMIFIVPVSAPPCFHKPLKSLHLGNIIEEPQPLQSTSVWNLKCPVIFFKYKIDDSKLPCYL